jgi:hypothetical protein
MVGECWEAMAGVQASDNGDLIFLVYYGENNIFVN